MKKITTATLALTLLTAPAFAGGTHSGGHDEMHVGRPGEASAVNRSIKIRMMETDDGEMLFEPAQLDVKNGETIRFEIENAGELEHEFVLDTHTNNQMHKEQMMKFPEMEHDDPNSVRLMDGANGEIIWTFSKTGTFEFACLIPGHYESGMKGDITVAGK